jgi:hypothetical protein
MATATWHGLLQCTYTSLRRNSVSLFISSLKEQYESAALMLDRTSVTPGRASRVQPRSDHILRGLSTPPASPACLSRWCPGHSSPPSLATNPLKPPSTLTPRVLPPLSTLIPGATVALPSLATACISSTLPPPTPRRRSPSHGRTAPSYCLTRDGPGQAVEEGVVSEYEW